MLFAENYHIAIVIANKRVIIHRSPDKRRRGQENAKGAKKINSSIDGLYFSHEEDKGKTISFCFF